MEFQETSKDAALQSPLVKRLEKVITPLERFAQKQASASILLVLTAIMALLVANSEWNNVIPALAATKAGIYLDGWDAGFTVKELINDGLLALFFFLIGLEVKREMLIGQLRNPAQALLVVAAALGGMVVPALIYSTINPHSPGHMGWAIPMATDTAFAIGILTFFTRRISINVSVFMAALAIFDDIGAIVVIALFYTAKIDTDAMFYACIPLLLLFVVNIAEIQKGWIYVVLGVVLWWFIHKSGIHATLAGLLLALFIPAKSVITQRSFISRIRNQIAVFEKSEKVDQNILGASNQHKLASNIKATANAASTPLQRWYLFLESPIAIIVLPLFAIFNVGIHLTGHTVAEALASPVTLGIIAGLVVGKPLGIMLFSIVAMHFHLGKMPENMRFTELIGVGLLAGIGFTMSLFITTLGFNDYPELTQHAKIGIFIASVTSAFLGAAWFMMACKRNGN